MLALTRRCGEEIIIDKESGEEIVIAVLQHPQQGIRIGIEASRRFEIFRREVLERKLTAQTAAR